MSTFFEKLTTTHASGTSKSAEPAKKSAHSASKEESRATRLKVDDDENVEINESDESSVEDEGELTVDIYDRGDEICIQSTVAGVKPEDLDVNISSDTVTIRGRRERMEEVKEDDYYYKELFWGTFSRSVILPEEIDDEAAEAVLKHGLLTIRLPKRKKRASMQKLKVKVN